LKKAKSFKKFIGLRAMSRIKCTLKVLVGIKRVFSIILAIGLAIDGWCRVCASCMQKTYTQVKHTFIWCKNSIFIDKSVTETSVIKGLRVKDSSALTSLVHQLRVEEEELHTSEFISNLGEELNINYAGVAKNKSHIQVSTDLNEDQKLAFNATKSSYIELTKQPTVEIKPTNVNLQRPQFITHSFVLDNKAHTHNSNYEFKSTNPSDFDKIWNDPIKVNETAYNAFFKTNQITSHIKEDENSTVHCTNLNNTEESAVKSLLKSDLEVEKKNFFQQGTELTDSLTLNTQEPLEALFAVVKCSVEEEIKRPIGNIVSCYVSEAGDLRDIIYTVMP
jgi:hypothetical protein